ncbi:MAG TPA: hypothetical protein VFG15_30330 [Amycolatopsis sp.]|nr:hypothetical protein [Amycolatopsis sp.]
MNPKLTSWVRTVVPGLWSAFVAWLVTLGLPDVVTSAAGGLGEAVVYPAALAAVYAAIRWAEPHLPDWLTRVWLGSAAPPTYGEPSAPAHRAAVEPPAPAWPVDPYE